VWAEVSALTDRVGRAQHLAAMVLLLEVLVDVIAGIDAAPAARSRQVLAAGAHVA
jgi:hypothetical protein